MRSECASVGRETVRRAEVGTAGAVVGVVWSRCHRSNSGRFPYLYFIPKCAALALHADTEGDL